MEIPNRFAVGLCTLGPIGNIPFAPGTWGSLVALLISAFTYLTLPADFFGPILICFAVISGLVGLACIGSAELSLKKSDPGCIIIDELCGQWLSLFPLIWIADLRQHPWVWLTAFILFRFFDILKPLGIYQLQKLPGAWGVMADDVLAGIYAALILSGLWFLLFL